MTYEEFNDLAINPPYIEQDSVYRIDVHCYGDPIDESQYEVRISHAFIYLDLESCHVKLKQIVTDISLKDTLFALYVYQLPLGKDISPNLHQRLWVYDRFGNLNSQSRCTAMIEDIDHPSAKFRGHTPDSIRFSPGDIVEVYDRENQCAKLAVVIKRPLTVEQCWDERKHVELACRLQGIQSEFTDDNYWLYADSDTYLLADGPDFRKNTFSSPSYDVFTLSRPLSADLRNTFAEFYNNVIEGIKRSQENTYRCIKEIHRLADLL